MAGNRNGGPLDRGTRLILSELRDLRVEMRADRQEDRRRAEEDRRRSDERFERMFKEFRQDSARRDAVNRKFTGDLIGDLRRDFRSVGLSIVKTLNYQSRLLERIDRNLGARRNGPPRPGNGGRS